jgi:hypothetical protein
MIRKGCQGKPGPDFFADSISKGRQLLAMEDANRLLPDERQQVSRILTLLTDQPRQTVDRRCPALLELLGPQASDSRQ